VLILVFWFVSALESFVALSGAQVHAQEQQVGKVYRIGFLRAGPPPRAWVEAFQQGLRERGYVDGRNLFIEYRLTDGSPDQLPRLADELVRLKVDVIVASGAPPAMAAKRATTSVPIVFTSVSYPVEIGLITNLARPEGNVTGLANTSADLGGKRLELLRELVPKMRRVAVLMDPSNPTNPLQLKEAQVAARALGLQVQPVPFRGPSDFDATAQAMRGADGLLLFDSVLITTHRARLAELAISSRLPAISIRDFAEVGGLMSYSAYLPDVYRRTATYVDKILKGAKPADLPVEQPTKFELVITIRTAKALGLTIPRSLLLRADQVIE